MQAGLNEFGVVGPAVILASTAQMDRQFIFQENDHRRDGFNQDGKQKTQNSISHGSSQADFGGGMHPILFLYQGIMLVLSVQAITQGAEIKESQE